MPARDRDAERLLAAVEAGAVVVFAGTASVIVILQTVLPVFGLMPGVVSDAAIGTLAASAVTIITARTIRRLRNGDNGDG